jgi:hypothetical protein
MYEIRVEGWLEGEHWAAWFDGLAISAGPGGQSIIRGCLPDQAALHGVLARIRDLNLVLWSVVRLDQVER